MATVEKPSSPLEPSPNCIVIPDDRRYELSHFAIPRHYRHDLDYLLVPSGVCDDRIEKLAHDIVDYYGDQSVHLICVLKGSRGFFAELVAKLNQLQLARSSPLVFEHYVRLKSYSGTASTGQLSVQSDDLSVLRDENVLIVEDIVDTGHTLLKFCKYLEEFEPRSVKTASLVEKRTEKNTHNVRADFVGFSVPDVFIVGKCLDYNEMYRDLLPICVLNSGGIARYRDA